MYLYRKTMQAVTLATAIVIFSCSLQAQFRIPQPERKTPRAVGVVETFKNGSRRLVPITFFYEKHYYDATFYHATPVPFTLYSETVYEVQQFGKPLGTFTIQSATQSTTQNSESWFGNGRFKLLPDASLASKKKIAPIVVEDPSKPVLHRRAGSEGDNPAAHPSPAPRTPATEDDPDRPKLHKRQGSESTPADASAQSPAQTQAPAAGQSSPSAEAPSAQPKAPADQTEESSGQDPDRPKLQRRDDSTAGKKVGGATPPSASTEPRTAPPATAPASSPTATSTASSKNPPAPAPTTPPPAVAELTPSDDPDHPVLRRGKPVQEQAGRDLPDFKLEEPISRQVAISDAGTSDTHPLIYVCPPEERDKIEALARELAQAELRRMAAQRGMASPAPAMPPVVAKTSARRRTTASKPAAPPELKLEAEQFVPYDLDYSNYATVVFSARYTPEAGATAGVPSGKPKSWVVTVVARQDEDKLVKLYSAVSDPRALDLYPEVRLVDALDPDGYGRAALLFREQKQDGVSWLLGRLTGYGMQTIFETPSR